MVPGQAMDDAMEVLESLAEPVDVNDTEQMVELVNSCLGTKFVSRFGDMICRMAIDAVRKYVSYLLSFPFFSQWQKM